MAKTKAKKHRIKLEREGKRNPEENRGVYALADLRTRKNKSKVEKMYQCKYKERLSDQYDNGTDKRSYLFVKYLA